MDEYITSDKLSVNIIDQIVEAQLKLGYTKEKMTFYYPLTSLNKLLNKSFKTVEECVEICNSMDSIRRSKIGVLIFESNKSNIGVTVPVEGVSYVHEKEKPSEFLVSLIDAFRDNHHLNIDDVERLFARFGEYERVEVSEDTGFMYAIWFKDGKNSGDEYVYCINIEMGHTIYHRFMRDDYEELIKSVL